MPRPRPIRLSGFLLLLLFPMLGADDPKPSTPVDANAAFEKLKGLVGDWEGTEDGRTFSVIYKLTGAGSALVETQLAGTEHEMVSIYHLDNDKLLMTHYCAVGNQPRLKLDPKASTPESLVFTFDGGTNFDPAKDMHIHGAKILFGADTNHLKSEWSAWVGGKPVGEATVFDLTRKK
jgi:hypothetical protein